MCIVKTPDIDTSSTAAEETEPTVIRNPYLDGTSPAVKAQRKGRSSLRIVRGSNTVSPSPTAPPIATTNPRPVSPIATAPGVSPVRGGGGGSSGIYIGTPRGGVNAY